MLAKAKGMSIGTIRKYGASFYKKTADKGWQRVPTGKGRTAFTKQENKKVKFIPTKQNLIFAFEDLKPPTPLSDLKARKYVIDKGYVKKVKDGFELTNKGTERYLELKRGKKEGRAKQLAKEYKDHEKNVIGIIKQQQKKIDKEKKPVIAEKEPWEMTQTEWDSELKARRKASIEKWNAEGSKGFPPSLNINTVSERIALAERAGYNLPEDSNIVTRMSFHELTIRAALSEGKLVPPKVLAEYPELKTKIDKKLKLVKKPVKSATKTQKTPTKINAKIKTQEYINKIKNISIMNESGKKTYIKLIKEAIRNKDKAMLDQYLKEVKDWVERNKKFQERKKVVLGKAKYIKRWKGKDGKWKYEYFRDKVDRKKAIETFSIKVKQKENEIANLKYEKCYVFDKSGKVLFEKSGEKSSISFTEEEMPKVRGAELFIHNHPLGVSFSPGDIKFLWANNPKEIKAIDQKYIYSAKINAFWSKDLWISFVDDLVAVTDNVKDMLELQVDKGLITFEEAEQNYWHDVWSYLSESHNSLEYKRVRRQQ